jgi:hypothetical protein
VTLKSWPLRTLFCVGFELECITNQHISWRIGFSEVLDAPASKLIPQIRFYGNFLSSTANHALAVLRAFIGHLFLQIWFHLSLIVNVHALFFSLQSK